MTAELSEPNRITITDMAVQHVTAVVELMRTVPEVSFCDWEDKLLLERHVTSSQSVSVVALDEWGEVVAGLIGGSLGVRGTISHVAVSDPHRRAGVGRRLVEHAIVRFVDKGVRRVFLFTHDVNADGAAFWRDIGFRPTDAETTFERDV